MRTFCIDIGNTSTHYGLVEGTTVLANGKLEPHRLDDPSCGIPFLLKCLRDEGTEVDGVSFCSVVPESTEILQAQLSSWGQVFHLTHNRCPGLAIHYPEPSEIGPDRLANAIGAQALFGTPAVIIDAGTATTIDIVSSHGGYEGGIIAPGTTAMARYLHMQTALLPMVDTRDIPIRQGIGKSTVDAIQLGCSVGFSGMVKALLDLGLKALEQKGEQGISIIATGGDIEHLKNSGLTKTHFDPFLTLKGLHQAFLRDAEIN